MKFPIYTIQEQEPDWPWWEDEQDWESRDSAVSALDRLRKDWPASKWRLVRRDESVLDV